MKNDNILITLGMTEEQIKAATDINLLPGRITSQAKGIYRAMTADGSYLVTLTGKFKHDVVDLTELPAVGDFIMIQGFPGEQKGVIERVYPRKQMFVRQAAGTETKPQIISANIDYAFLAMSCNENFNVNRMERFLIAAWDSGAEPIILLTKADLVDELEREVMAAELSGIGYGVPVYFISAESDDHIDDLKALLQDNKTATILGSSGIGKSTLINRLMGQEVMVTSSIRESDSKGKHTTTHRELLMLPTGGVIIDTPGMREFQLWSDGDNTGLSTEFEDVEELVSSCKFNDCTHQNEPGCAVQAALEDGTLSTERYERYQKYQRELAFQERRGNEALERLERDKWKKLTAGARASRQIKRRR